MPKSKSGAGVNRGPGCGGEVYNRRFGMSKESFSIHRFPPRSAFHILFLHWPYISRATTIIKTCDEHTHKEAQGHLRASANILFKDLL